ILRARETAETINQKHQLPIQLEPALKEIEYGEWIGKTFHEVRSDPNYNPYFRDEHAPVGVTGESLRQVCDRGVQFIESLRKEELVGKIALVSHADWIKCILLHYLEKPLSHLYQLRIDNASISYLLFEKNTARVIAVNAATTIESLLLPRGPL
ncbi:MAG: histidine phosphatase family protein, partial [Deltaproteobacteria bacterium]|nr:histidine phosphatase family protein [Deltaproteobacteria bacterium]